MQINSSLDMPKTAIILAGGLGTRLRPAIADRPKVLALVAGRPFLEYLLAYLAGQGIKQVILSIGYLGEQVQAEIGNGAHWGVAIEYLQEKEPLGTGGALKLCSQGLHGPFFALNGDTLFQVSLMELWYCHNSQNTSATVALRKIRGEEIEDHSQRGCVTVDSGGRIRSFDEKPGLRIEPSTINSPPDAILTNGGIYILSPEALASLENGQAASLEREVFPALAAEGRLAGCPQMGYFIDIGTPQSLALFELDVQKGSSWLRGN